MTKLFILWENQELFVIILLKLEDVKLIPRVTFHFYQIEEDSLN